MSIIFNCEAGVVFFLSKQRQISGGKNVLADSQLRQIHDLLVSPATVGNCADDDDEMDDDLRSQL